jgi:hypothetical protein
MKISEVLTDESKWTKGHYAINTDGDVISAMAPEAVQYCFIGAIRKAAGDDWEAKIKQAHTIATSLGYIHPDSHEPFGSLICFNDNPDTTWDQVKKIIELTDKEVTT